MTWGHIALLVAGVIGLMESSWGLSAPEKVRKAVAIVAEETPERNVLLGLVFAGLSLLLWIPMTSNQRPSDWALMIVSWILAGGAYANFRRGGVHTLLRVLILNRSNAGIRILYAVEFLLAATLVALAVLRY